MKALLILCSLAAALPARAADFDKDKLDNWHHWRGPLASGEAPNADPPLKWDAQTNVKWKVELPGRGSSTPIVWKDRVFVLATLDTGKQADPKDVPKPDPNFKKNTNPPRTYHQYFALCFDRNTGKQLWKHMAREAVPHEGHHGSHTYAAFSPTTDGERLYAWFGSHGLWCYDLDGKPLWNRDLGRMETRLGWGEGGSPVVHGDTLVVTFDHEGASYIVGLDRKSGEIRWKADRDEKSTWSTPLVVEHKGTTQVITNGTERVRSYDLANGKLLWTCGGQTVNPIPSPVVRNGAVICMSGYRGAFACAISLDALGNVTDTDKVLWTLGRGTPYVPSPLLVGDRLYFTQGNEALLTLLDATNGKPILDRVRLPGAQAFYASPAAAKDRVYLVDRGGTCLVLRRADKLEVLSTNRMEEGIDASPVLVGKQLFLRGQKNLYCIEEK